MKKRKSVSVVKMNPLMHYFQKTREDDKKEDRNESDKEEEDGA